MPRRRDAPCSKCKTLTWWNSKCSAPKDKIICHACRKADHVPRGLGLTRVEAAARARAAAALITYRRVCESCPEVFTSGAPNKRYCDDCQNGRRRDHYRKKNRGRLGYQKSIRNFPINALGDRDRWLCWLCETGVDARLKSRHPGMASYDHVVPTSAGGSDDPENLRLAHLLCNVRRGAALLL